jgi:transcriptional regulator with XRE-family HTH domain
VARDSGKAFDATAHRRAFGDRVRSLRRAKDWTQEQLAEAAAMDRSYLADIEAGHRNPTLDVIHRLASGLEVAATELFTSPS